MTTNKTTTKASFAAEASHQLAYILSALGIQDDHGATCALRAALESKGSLKIAAEALAETLRTVKITIRASINDSKTVSEDRNTARAGRKILAAELRRTERDLVNVKGLLRNSLANSKRDKQDIASLRTTASQAVLDLSQSTLDVAFWRQRAETAEGLLDSARTDIAELVTSRDFWKAQAGALAPIQPDPPLSPHRSTKVRERRAKRQAADDAQRQSKDFWQTKGNVVDLSKTMDTDEGRQLGETNDTVGPVCGDPICDDPQCGGPWAKPYNDTEPTATTGD